MQALVDHRGMFSDIYLGWPGKVHDARVFSNSSLYAKGQQGTLVPNWTKCLNGVDVPLCILGDPTYPSLPWLMKAYTEHDNTVCLVNKNTSITSKVEPESLLKMHFGD